VLHPISQTWEKSKHMISEVLKVCLIWWAEESHGDPHQSLSYVFTGPCGVHHILCIFAHPNSNFILVWTSSSFMLLKAWTSSKLFWAQTIILGANNYFFFKIHFCNLNFF
jgi:hypothetical protein